MPEAGGQLAYADDKPADAGAGGQSDIQRIGEQLLEWSNSPNIAPDVPHQMRQKLGIECVYGYEIDKKSRKAWEDRANRYMELALQDAPPKTFPWANCSNVIWPLLSQAVNEFASAIYPAIMDGERIVNSKIIGTDKGVVDQAAMQQRAQQMSAQGQQQNVPPEQVAQQLQNLGPIYVQGKEQGAKRKRADRVSDHMSWQVLSQQTEWQADSDRMFRALPILGCAARKSWFDPVWGRNCSMYVSMMDLVVNYHAKSLDTAPRVTEVFELYPNEIEDKIRSGEYLKFNYGTATMTAEQSEDGKGGDYHGDKYAPHLFLEQHCFWDLDGDGYEEPYTVVIHKTSGTVVRIVARYEADGIRLTEDKTRIAKIEPLQYYTLYQFMPNPKSSIYGHGFGHVLGPINESLNSALNQMFDAGTLQNLGGGFVGSGLSMHSGTLRFKMGEFKPVNTGGVPLRENFYMPEFRGPSEVMLRLFALLVDAGRELAGIKAITTGQTPPASTDPETMMAMVETGMRVFKDVYKRVLRGLDEEFAKLFGLNRKYMPKQGFKYQKADEEFEVSAEDYATTSGVESVGDPDMMTDMQRLARSKLLFAFKDDPKCNPVEIRRRIFEAANIEDIDQILLENQPPNPLFMLEVQLKQAQVQVALATDQNKRAQSIFFMMQAHKAATDAGNAGQAQLLDAQLDREWMEIERANSQIGALHTAIEAHRAEAAMISAKAKTTKKAA